MSYWVYLGKRKPVTVDKFEEGGTYCLGGQTEAELNVTYNYSKHFPFRSLHEMYARDTINGIKDAIERLGTKRDNDYWNPTEGNVGYTLSILLQWAKQHPNAKWRVS